MNFLQYDFNLDAGDIVEVTLDNQANVRLMDDQNLNNYKRGQHFRYYGGLARQTPFRLTAPSAGRWNVVIDLGGHTGTVNASVKTLKN